MAFLSNLISFLNDKTAFELFRMFWFFIVFDFTRYVLTDIVFFIYYMFYGDDEKKRKEARLRLFRERPLVSVIAPGKNEGKHLEALANSISDQTYKNLELIVVDDGSDDNSFEIGRKLMAMGKIDNFFRNEVRGGKASAANFALRYAKGKFIVHLDADSHLNQDSIESIILPFFMDSHIGAISGALKVNNPTTSFATLMQGIEYIKSISIGRLISSKLGVLRIVSGAFGAFRTDLLRRLGGWDVGPGLDGDITVKIRKLGYKIHFEHQAICYTNVPNTFKKLGKQRYRWDRSLIRFRLRKHFDILMPSRNFKILNFLSAFENILFNFVFNIKWWFYVGYICYFYVPYLEYILFINYFIYLLCNIIEYGVCCVILRKSMTPEERWMFLYVPLVPLYNCLFLRLVRTWAHLMELIFKVSYEDKWNPWKVSKHAKEHRL